MIKSSKKGYGPFARALKQKANDLSAEEFGLALGVEANTVFKVWSSTIRPGIGMMRTILAKYPDLYDLAMEGYFGPRPSNPVSVPHDADPVKSFGLCFKTMQGKRSNAEFATFLGIGYLTVYTVWKGKPVPAIYVLQRIVAKLPHLYDLAAAVHFGPPALSAPV